MIPTQQAYADLARQIGGQATAEVAIEAWRDASENEFNPKLNPYETSTYAHTEYRNACYQQAKKENANAT